MKEFINETIQRAKADTPPFFKKLGFWARVTAIVTGGLAAGVTAIMTAGIAIPAIVPAVLAGVAAMSSSVAGTAVLAVNDQNKVQSTDNK